MYCTSQQDKFVVECDEPIPTKRARVDDNDKIINQFLKLEERLNLLYNSRYEASDSILDMLSRPCVLDELDQCRVGESCGKLEVAEALNRGVAMVIEYAKSFDVFRRMPLTDKITLLRDVTLILELLESAYKALNDDDSLINQDFSSNDGKRKEVMEHFEEGKNSEEAVVLLVLESLSRAELDRTEFVLFKAIVFLRSECFNLSNQSCTSLFKKRQEMLDVLFEYMLNTHGKQGPVKYGNVLSILWTLFTISQSYRGAILKFDLKPLCKEILSSKMPEALA
ncbi:unnamed protein product [Enterobius vermicularis]|uniref:NR LBD domain-containing protein n=1 Tax=Enterobius vermicularis TaxID=51028 RepID=A0A0N4VBT2_ENTVE|nr:unnamed protein product [Enterobius vermicularis]